MLRLMIAHLRSNRTVRGIATTAILSSATVGALADESIVDSDQNAHQKTPETLAFESARDVAGRSYITCLRNSFREDDELSVAEAQSVCAGEAKLYSEYLPAERAEHVLEWTAYQVKPRS